MCLALKPRSLVSNPTCTFSSFTKIEDLISTSLSTNLRCDDMQTKTNACNGTNAPLDALIFATITSKMKSRLNFSGARLQVTTRTLDTAQPHLECLNPVNNSKSLSQVNAKECSPLSKFNSTKSILSLSTCLVAVLST